MHVNKVSKNVVEQGPLQSLIKTFTCQVAHWWGTHQSQLQTWMIASSYFIEIFRCQKLTTKIHISKFLPGNDPKEHIDNCEKEWKRSGYLDERIWPHLFTLTLDGLPNKWYKIEESHGDTFTRKTLK